MSVPSGPFLREPSNQFIGRMAEAHGGQYVKEFAWQMFNQLGMRVLVLSAHHDTNGALSMSRKVYPLFVSLDIQP